MTAIGGLGRAFDICTGIVPVDLAAGANTGHRVHMRNYGGCAIVGFVEAGPAAASLEFDVKEHSANTGGTSQDLDVVTVYYVKAEASLDGDETWTRVTQTAASEVTDADWDDANQVLVVIEVSADQLSDGFEWLSCDIADTSTSTGQLGCVLYVMYDLRAPRAPQNLPQPNA